MSNRERAERLVREETRAMIVRLVRKLEPRLPVAEIERSAGRLVVDFGEFGLTDAEVERCAAMGDDDVRSSWRAHFEPKLVKLYAPEMPS